MIARWHARPRTHTHINKEHVHVREHTHGLEEHGMKSFKGAWLSKSTTTVLFSLEGADVKSSIIRRRALDKFSQVRKDSGSDGLTAETRYFGYM